MIHPGWTVEDAADMQALRILTEAGDRSMRSGSGTFVAKQAALGIIVRAKDHLCGIPLPIPGRSVRRLQRLIDAGKV